VGLSPLGTSATVWSIVPVPDDRWRWMWNSRWNHNWQWKPKYSEKTCPSATLSTTNPTWPDLGSNPGRRRVYCYCCCYYCTNDTPSGGQHVPRHLRNTNSRDPALHWANWPQLLCVTATNPSIRMKSNLSISRLAFIRSTAFFLRLRSSGMTPCSLVHREVSAPTSQTAQRHIHSHRCWKP
jgi:hypothetical protein